MARGGYHHGDLRAALVRASRDLLAESGPAGFSVARVAKRLGVSTAAPYRHFPDREHLLSAVAATAARELASDLAAAADRAGDDPVARFAAAGAAYARFTVRTGAGFLVIFSTELSGVADPERTDATRALMSRWIDLVTATGDRPMQDSLRLIEEQVALAQGYATLYTQGFFHRASVPVEEIATRVEQGSRRLVS
ncbi:TetR/AcrR family transcriptional regulator [Catenuloplanes atrovinosus]|uniref:AcrR family transcriptional regulator n=1 Tax=Catenuloplanes atrovinosus TaxID=137266 RepID=A0AAE3YPT8_9ACTN|nr:helix-turn-helix domain-containing protein [Catenuloplanes atrovinosus]MDR7276437.1 AcrR family transcriptional regulator [Catenuloplanes atrovinosus]